jgi:hypothetical protein
VVPVHTPLDLKALAMAVGGKKTRMAEVAAAGRATGYVAGGISPHGQCKRIPVVTGASAAEPATILCSAGRRGLAIEIAPAGLVKATAAPIAASLSDGFRFPQPSRSAASPGSASETRRMAARQASTVAGTSPMRRVVKRPPPDPHAIAVTA